MRGLRKQEDLKVERFFAIVQETAAKQGCVFFADAGDGNDIVTDEFEGEEIMGWLIPADKADEFEPLFLKDEVPEDWDDYFCWAEWNNDNGLIISFVFY